MTNLQLCFLRKIYPAYIRTFGTISTEIAVKLLLRPYAIEMLACNITSEEIVETLGKWLPVRNKRMHRDFVPYMNKGTKLQRRWEHQLTRIIQRIVDECGYANRVGKPVKITVEASKLYKGACVLYNADTLNRIEVTLIMHISWLRNFYKTGKYIHVSNGNRYLRLSDTHILTVEANKAGSETIK